MVSALKTIKWSLDDYHRMIDGGILTDRRAELLWGEIVEMAPEGIPHAHLSSRAGDYAKTTLAESVVQCWLEVEADFLGSLSRLHPDRPHHNRG